MVPNTHAANSAMMAGHNGPLHGSIAAIVCLFVTLCVWALFGDTNLKYMIYLLPPLLVMISVSVNRGVFDIDPRGLTALFLFAAIAAMSLANNPDFNFFAQRDLIIIGGYLLLFALPMRLVPMVVDGILVCLIATVVLEATAKGFSLQVDFLASEGIMESIMAFPLGAVLLYYVYNRSWTRALIAFLVFFATFKRIAFVGIALVIAIEMAVWITGRRLNRRVLATMAAIGLCILSLYMTPIVEFAAEMLDIRNINANALSLGRVAIAEPMWDRIYFAGFLDTLVGFGPGAADRLIQSVSESANPHNDWLKILFDYGYFGLITFHVIFYLMFPKTRLGTAIYAYSAVIFCTDNILIYMHYFAFVALVARTPARQPEPPVAVTHPAPAITAA